MKCYEFERGKGMPLTGSSGFLSNEKQEGAIAFSLVTSWRFEVRLTYRALRTSVAKSERE